MFLILNLTTTRLGSFPPSSYSNLKHSEILMLLRNPVSVDSRRFSRWLSLTRADQRLDSGERALRRNPVKWAWNFHFSHCWDSSFFVQLILLYYITVSRFSQYHRKCNQNTVLKAWGRFLFVRFPFETSIRNSHDVFFILFLKIFWLHSVVYGTSASWPGIEPTPHIVEMQSLNLWTSSEIPYFLLISYVDLMSISLVASLFQVSLNTDYMGYTQEHVAANEYGASDLSDKTGK